MKMIQAIIRPEKLDITRKALEGKGFAAMSILKIPGGEEPKGFMPEHKGETVKVSTLPKIMLMMIVSDHDVGKIVSIIQANEQTGNLGDGKIFVI